MRNGQARLSLPLLALYLLVFPSGCGESGPERKATYPVTGTVYVDGSPAEGVRVELHSVQDPPQPDPTFSTAITDSTGKFSFATYEVNDGAPAGQYVLTFMWGKIDPFSMEYTGPDRLNGKYLDPLSSEIKVTVEEGKPADLGQIDLKTK